MSLDILGLSAADFEPPFHGLRDVFAAPGKNADRARHAIVERDQLGLALPDIENCERTKACGTERTSRECGQSKEGAQAAAGENFGIFLEHFFFDRDDEQFLKAGSAVA